MLLQYVADERMLMDDTFVGLIWQAIPPLIPSTTRGGKQLLLKFAEDSSEYFAPFAALSRSYPCQAYYWGRMPLKALLGN